MPPDRNPSKSKGSTAQFTANALTAHLPASFQCIPALSLFTKYGCRIRDGFPRTRQPVFLFRRGGVHKLLHFAFDDGNLRTVDDLHPASFHNHAGGSGGFQSRLADKAAVPDGHTESGGTAVQVCNIVSASQRGKNGGGTGISGVFPGRILTGIFPGVVVGAGIQLCLRVIVFPAGGDIIPPSDYSQGNLSS